MSTRYSMAAIAAVLLFASFGGTSTAWAADGETASVVTCTAGKSVVFRAAGHPGKSSLLPRRVTSDAARCSQAAAQRLMLVSFTDAPGGAALLAGKADRAIHQLTGQDPGSDNVLALNNLCVAHTVLRQWTEARASCDAAVTATVTRQSAKARWPGEQRRLANKVAAAVYSNRAVMNWLSLDVMAAQGDFARARAIAPRASFVVRNSELATRLPARVEYGNLPIG